MSVDLKNGTVPQERISDEKLQIPGDPRTNWRVFQLGADQGAIVFDVTIAGGLGGEAGIIRAIDRGETVSGKAIGYRLSYRDTLKYAEAYEQFQSRAREQRTPRPRVL